MSGAQTNRLFKAALFVFAALLSIGASGSANAADSGPAYPTKPIALIVGFAPGGPVDLIARALAKDLGVVLGQRVNVVNKAAAQGTIAFEEVLRAAPDGYTLGTTGHSPGRAALNPIPDAPIKWQMSDQTPICASVDSPVVWVVNAGLPYGKSMKDFISYAKAKPDTIRVGNAGPGSTTETVAKKFANLAGLNVRHITFQGSAPAALAVLGGHIEAMVSTPATIVQHQRAGTINVLASSASESGQVFPGTPTFKDLGYDYTFGVYHVLYGPKGMPAPVVGKLNDACRKTLQSADFKDFAAKNFLLILGGAPEDAQKRMQADFDADPRKK